MEWLKDFDSKALPTIEDFPPVAKGCLLVETEVLDNGIKLIFNLQGPEIGFILERPKEDDAENVFIAKKMKFIELAKLCSCKPSELPSKLDSLIGKSFTLETKSKVFINKQGKAIPKVNLYKMSLEK